MAGMVFVLSAPSGTGKSTIVSNVIEAVSGLDYSVSHTSRSPRAYEREGIDYFFVDRASFESMIHGNAFIEWARVYDEYYGTSFSSVEKSLAGGRDIIMDVDTVGAENIRRHFEKSVLIYILPPSLEILEKRLRGRGTDNDRIIAGRLGNARDEIEKCGHFDYIIVNDALDEAVDRVRAVILSERSRVENMASVIKERLGPHGRV